MSGTDFYCMTMDGLCARAIKNIDLTWFREKKVFKNCLNILKVLLKCFISILC